MRLLIFTIFLTTFGFPGLRCAEPQVIPSDIVTYITLEYRNGDMIYIDVDARKIQFTDKKKGIANEEDVSRANADQMDKIKSDLLKLILNGLSKGLFTKESSDFVSATVGFNGPTLKFEPRNDHVADEIGEYGKSIKAMLGK